MIDISKTIAPKSDQLNADDLIAESLTIKITGLTLLADAQPVAIQYEGDNGKPWKPCKSMRRVLVMIWGGDGQQYIGRYLTLYRDERVVFGGVAVGGIRISHMSHIDKEITLALTTSKSSRKPFVVKPLGTRQVIQSNQDDSQIDTLKSLGYGVAQLGIDKLKYWWTQLGGANQKLVGGAGFLDELKAIAASVAENATVDDEPESHFLTEVVNDMLERLETDEKLQGTKMYLGLKISSEAEDLMRTLRESGNEELLSKLEKAINP